MTNRLNDLIPAIHAAYATAYPNFDTDRASHDRMTDDIADAIIASSSILADATRMTSDSMIDTAHAMIFTLTALNRIAYCDDFTMTESDALTSTITPDFIRDLHNINCDDTAIRTARFFAPIFDTLPDDIDDCFEMMTEID